MIQARDGAQTSVRALCVLQHSQRMQTRRCKLTSQNPKQAEQINIGKNKMKNKYRTNNLWLRNTNGKKQTNTQKPPTSSMGIASWHTSALTLIYLFFFNRENIETIWLKNSEKKEANPGSILQLHLYGAHTNTAAEGHKKLSDQKSSLFCTGVRSYISCKPIAR